MLMKVDIQDEGKKERTAPKLQSRHEAKACLCLFLQKRKHVPGLFRLSSSPVFSKSSHSSVVYCLWLVGSTFWCFGSVWHQQGTQQENEVRCQRRTRLLDCSIGGALRVSSGASGDLLSCSSYGRSGCAVSSLRKPENGTQSTCLFFRFHTTIS